MEAIPRFKVSSVFALLRLLQNGYKQENVILVGVMPGPKESSLNINSYLSPLVEELNLFWRGVLIPIERQGVTLNINVRLALSCVACDIPASRKVSGHNARLGCLSDLTFLGTIGRTGNRRVTSRAVQEGKF